MRNLLRADLCRMFRTRRLWLLCGLMAAVAAGLAAVQRCAMGYTVALNRVIFLPMAFYGMAAAALVGLFVGDDFAGGMLRAKLVAGKTRRSAVFSLQIACWAGCAALYLFTVAFALAIGLPLFERNVTAGEVLAYTGLGLLTCAAYGSAFCAASVLAGGKSAAVAVCMALSFGMLFLSLHTHQTLSHPPYPGGALYPLLHDLNPTGQAAQLSAMECLNPWRFAAADALWACVSVFALPVAFGRKNL